MLNKVQIIGNLGDDPKISSMNNGKEVANLSVGVSESWKDKTTGEKKTKTEWCRVVVFSEGLVNVIKNYVNKGSKVYIEGAMQTRKYDKNGVDHYTTEIVLNGFNGKLILLDSKKESSQGSFAESAQTVADDMEQEIPF